MKILTTPHQLEEAGQLIEVPETLQPYRILWAAPHCRQHNFGVIFRQDFAHKYYHINIYHCDASEKVLLYPHFDKPAIALLIFLKGCVVGFNENIPVIELQAGKFSLVYIPAGTHQMQLNTGMTQAYLVVFEKNYLAELTEGWPMQKKLLDLIDSSSKTGVPYPSALLSYEAKAEIARMNTSGKKDYLLILELKSCLTKLLGLYLTSIAEKEHLLSMPDIPYKDTLIKIWEAIRADPNIHEHTLNKLALTYNLHTKTLGRNFFAMFGSNLSDFVREQCMQKAYMLVTTTDMPLQAIAFELGYSELTNFNRAFKLQFKASPNALRALK